MDIDKQQGAYSAGFIRGILRQDEISMSEELMLKVGSYLAEAFAKHVEDQTDWSIKVVKAHKWMLFKSRLIARIRYRG